MNKLNKSFENINRLSKLKFEISEEHVRELISEISNVFSKVCAEYGYDKRQILKVTTKMRDAGRRSPPWKPTSSRVLGRPQDGSDGNRIKRWLMTPDHKFYANEIDATLVEIKYYLQLLSMNDAPLLPENTIQESFNWLVEHDILPNRYLDPIQLIPISLREVMEDARTIQSGHLHPLDRGGKHIPKNAFLMLHRSNQLQGNLTVDELVALMNEIIKRHYEKKVL
jgi:hypothetical protein